MENATLKKKHSDQLIFLGVLLFLLGLVTGLVVPVFTNPRLGVSSHIEGVLNGIFLVVLGLIWHKVDLSNRWLTIGFWLALYGTFTNWLGILIAAIFNAGGMLGIAANGKEGSPLAEAIVQFCLVSLSIAMLAVAVIVLLGLKRNINQAN